MKIDGFWLMCWNFQDQYLLSALISTGQILIERTALKIRTELEEEGNNLRQVWHYERSCITSVVIKFDVAILKIEKNILRQC